MKNFTEREEEVLFLLLKGLNNNQISNKLFISNHTTKAHVASIFKKLEVRNRVQAAIMCVKTGFIKPQDLEKLLAPETTLADLQE